MDINPIEIIRRTRVDMREITILKELIILRMSINMMILHVKSR